VLDSNPSCWRARVSTFQWQVSRWSCTQRPPTPLQQAMAKYSHFTGVPDFSVYEGWETADLMIKASKSAARTRRTNR